ncbi:type II toxin-antitoxin system HicA family toxin [Pseudonocardia sp. 73-21]|uniref:type II toxin-antitoxin system HicA family toxin n=1 Tax=unclassified Pseudonocardia TaxID=2619320 RepID=UPI0034439AB3
MIRQDARHEVWRNPASGARTTVPRHRELPPPTARVICRQPGVDPVLWRAGGYAGRTSSATG